MSRSFKHTPHKRGPWKDQSTKRYAKRKIRRRTRRKITDEDMSQHSGYKKLFHPFDVYERDTLPGSFEQYYADILAYWNKYDRAKGKPCPDREEKKKEYQKLFTRK